MTDMNPPTTAAQTAHTPTPWTFDEVPTSCGRAFRIGSREIIDGHEASKSRGALTLPAYAVIYDDYGSGETVNKANASYIVECCNNYSSALAQLRQAREALAKFVDACEAAPPLQLLSELNEACLFAKSTLTTTAPKEKP